jgi:hypothetical protein
MKLWTRELPVESLLSSRERKPTPLTRNNVVFSYANLKKRFTHNRYLSTQIDEGSLEKLPALKSNE